MFFERFCYSSGYLLRFSCITAHEYIGSSIQEDGKESNRFFIVISDAYRKDIIIKLHSACKHTAQNYQRITNCTGDVFIYQYRWFLMSCFHKHFVIFCRYQVFILYIYIYILWRDPYIFIFSWPILRPNSAAISSIIETHNFISCTNAHKGLLKRKSLKKRRGRKTIRQAS